MIEVGDYIRTRGVISQITKIDFDEVDKSLKWYWYDDNEHCTNKPYIEKYSKNIIDLIEVGDLVNGHLVMQKGKDGDLIIDDGGYHSLWLIDIKTILTKEQYEQNCFRVGDKND